MIHVSAEQVVLIAELLNAADLKGWNAEVGDHFRRLNRLETDTVGRFHHSEAAVVDRVCNYITPISIAEPRIIFRNDVHVVPPAIGPIEIRINRNFVKVSPMNEVFRFVKPK